MSSVAAEIAGLGELVADPSWFLEGYDPPSRRLRLVKTSRQILTSQAFVAEGLAAHSAIAPRTVTERELVEALPAAAGKPHLNFIWHTAFCCSTLLARLLDCPGKNLSLKEPAILLVLGEAQRQRAIGAGQPFSHRFAELAFRLLARRFDEHEQITIKPTNGGNLVLRDALSMTEGQHLLMYSDCRSFLVSIARKNEYGRRYVRELYSYIHTDATGQPRFPAAVVTRWSDLQIAAVVWHMQIEEFRRNIAAAAQGRVMSLDCDAFLAAPLETLVKVDAFLGLGLGRPFLEAAVNGPVFTSHAKEAGMSYGIEDRRADHARAAISLGKDLDEVVAWSYALCKTSRGAPVGHPLVALDKAYGP